MIIKSFLENTVRQLFNDTKGFLVAKEYDFEFIAEQLSKTQRNLDNYQEYERKLVEQKIIEEYIHEDEDDEDYDNASLTDFSEGIELTGTKIEHDEGKRIRSNFEKTIQSGVNSTRK